MVESVPKDHFQKDIWHSEDHNVNNKIRLPPGIDLATVLNLISKARKQKKIAIIDYKIIKNFKIIDPLDEYMERVRN